MAEHPPSETILKAQSGLAAALDMDPGCVTIGTGDAPPEIEAVTFCGGAERTNLLLMLHKTGSDIDQPAMEKALLKQFADIAPLAAVARTKSDEELACEVGGMLKQAVCGTDFNAKLLEWPGFDPEVMKQTAMADYAVSDVRPGAYGIEMDVHVPRQAAKDEDPKKLQERLAESIRARLPAIQAMLADRAEKYIKTNLLKEGKGEQEIADAANDARCKMEKLTISVNVTERNSVKITLRSPDQAEALAKAPAIYAEPDNGAELRATNPLHALSNQITKEEPSPQLHKALSRSFLFAGENAMEMFPAVAGTNDIKNAVAKELRRVETANPEKKAAFAAILASPLFKNHWAAPDSPDAALPLPVFRKDPKQADMMEVWIPLAKDKVKCTVEALAALAPQPSCPQPMEHAHAAPAAAVPPPMDVKPMLLELMQQLIIPAAGAPGNVVLQPQAAPSREASQPQVYTAG